MRRRFVGKKFSRLSVKGLKAGAQTAKRVIAEHGCPRAKRSAKELRDLVTYYGDSFEKSYTTAYNKVVAKSCGGLHGARARRRRRR